MQRLREWIVRIAGTVRRHRSDADLQEELRFHLELAEEDARRRGESPRAARLRAGGPAPAMDALRDQSRLAWLDAIRADAIFGWRQLNRYRTANATAILSLALAIGATTAATRLVDAVLWRPLPVTDPSRLFVVTTASTDGHTADVRDDFDYPTYREYARAIADRADVMVVGMAAREPVTIPPAEEPESLFREYVSGNLFGVFGLRPAAGRLLTSADDDRPGAHPVAVLSYDYWARRFAADPGAIGRTIRLGKDSFEIVGVAPRGFTGTEPGAIVDLFVPATMNVAALDSPGWSWFRLWVKPKPSSSAIAIEQVLRARFPKDDPHTVPAGAGVSGAQKTFRRPLTILAGLAALVLLVACANVGNLLTARGIARTREMTLRVSIGAGRGRLIQLVLIESLMLAAIASAIGAFIAFQSAPFVIGMLAAPDRPVRLVLDSGLRAFGFDVALTLIVTVLFGLAPALRASAARPVEALKATHPVRGMGPGTWMLIGVQVALSAFLLVAAALFVGTFDRLLARPLGFSHQRVLLLPAEAPANEPAPAWIETAKQLRQVAGVESAAIAGWAPLTGNRWRGQVRVPGVSERVGSVHLIDVGPSYFETLRIALLAGRDFESGESGVAIVNDAFARAYFDGASPIGRGVLRGGYLRVTIVGLVRDAAYSSVREPDPPTMYLPLEARSGGTFIVRTAGNVATVVPSLKRALAGANPALGVRAAEPLSAYVEQQMVRERLLATLSMFFAATALLIAGLGLYGVLNGTVVRQRREIGIRMALGARTADVITRIASRTAMPTLAGVAAGLVGGIAFGRLTRSLLFQMTPGQPSNLLPPLFALAAVAMVAAMPPAVRASRIDPAETLRSE